MAVCEEQTGKALRGLLFAGGTMEVALRPLASQKSKRVK
jgi:hypothetical protein